MSLLTGRYSGAPESTIDYDIRQIHSQGVAAYTESILRGELSEAFWDAALLQELDTSSSSSPHFKVFLAAQVMLGDRGFLSKDITVTELIEVKSDIHHIFPKDFLKKNRLPRGQYNQVANYAVTQSEINIAIGNKEPKAYVAALHDQCRGGKKRYGNITDATDIKANLVAHCIPDSLVELGLDD
jgi:hypothetical protein